MKFLFLLFPLVIFSQESVNPKVNAYIDSLGTNTNYFFLEERHPGMIFMFRTNEIQYECVKNDYYVSTDLYWKDLNENYWKKSFQKCSDETPIGVDSSYLNFAERNFEITKTIEGDNINFEHNQNLRLIELDRKINSNL